MAELPPTKEEKVYINNLTQIFQKMMKTRTPDFRFILEGKGDEEAVKIPAHKDVLAAMSPVFDAMFNGELKEKGDVKIVDASAAAFEEFLQFFYNDQVKLTMENIDDVLNLAHKYDVSDYFQMAVVFLKEHLNSKNLIWGLQLALKYESDDLKAFCKGKIKNGPRALDVFKTEECDTLAKMQRPSSANIENTLLEALSIANEVIFTADCELERFRSKCVHQFVVSNDTIYTDAMISPVEKITLNPNVSHTTLWLREIHFTKVFTKCGSACQLTQLKGTVLIFRHYKSDSATIFEQQFGMNSDENYIKLSEPLYFDRGYYHDIIVKTLVSGYPFAIEKEDINVEFKDKLTICENPKYSLIDRLYFEEFPIH